jgi:hypothetical protein
MQGQMKPHEAGCELDDKLVALIQQ